MLLVGRLVLQVGIEGKSGGRISLQVGLRRTELRFEGSLCGDVDDQRQGGTLSGIHLKLVIAFVDLHGNFHLEGEVFSLSGQDGELPDGPASGFEAEFPARRHPGYRQIHVLYLLAVVDHIDGIVNGLAGGTEIFV